MSDQRFFDVYLYDKWTDEPIETHPSVTRTFIDKNIKDWEDENFIVEILCSPLDK